jgi:hypothetical protein
MNKALSAILAATFLTAASALAQGTDPLRVPGKPVVSQAAKSLAAPALRLPAFPVDKTSAIRLGAKARPDSAPIPQGDDKRTRIGSARDVALDAEAGSLATPLQWVAAPGGGQIARLSLTSPLAGAVRVGLVVRSLPRGSELRVAGSGTVIGPLAGNEVAAVARERGLFWTPITEGETQTIELWIPAGADAAEARVSAQTVSHIDGRPSDMFKSTGAGASGSCNKDVACVAATDPAIVQAARSVAKMVYTENGSTYLCSATLINDGNPASQVPYLYTAAHCVDSQAVAATLHTFWFFEASTCGGGAKSFRQLSAGATLVYANAARDVALLRLTDAAPEGAWFSGWDATPVVTGDALVGLHHPAGDLKKASIGEAVAGGVSFNIAAWKIGTTEGGSSGSGLFTRSGDELVLRGGLRGGTASCQSSGDVQNTANRDQYSRLDLELPSLAAWLKSTPAAAVPAENFTGVWWNPAEPGWGASVMQGATGGAFVTVYAYDADGTSMWIAMPDPKWQSARVLEGTLYITHSQPLEATYDAAKFAAAAAGTGRIEFAADGSGKITLVMSGKTIVKPIAKYAI